MQSVKLREGEEQAIVDIAVRSTLKFGRRCPEDISVLLPMWKETTLYKRGIFLSKSIFTTHAPAWKVKKAIQELDNKEFFLDLYSRDFFQGLFDASSRMYANGNYKRAEFGGRKHLREFLESDVHGQRIDFVKMSGDRKRLSRMGSLPFMEIPGDGNLDKWFVGAMCGSDMIMVDEEPMMKVKDVCKANFDRLGILYYDIPKSNNIMISCFYFMLYMSEFPDFFLSFWMSKVSHKGLRLMPKASLASAATWKVMGKRALVRDALPFMLEPKTLWRMGYSAKDIKNEAKLIRSGFIDERIRKRCERWKTLNEVSE